MYLKLDRKIHTRGNLDFSLTWVHPTIKAVACESDFILVARLKMVSYLDSVCRPLLFFPRQHIAIHHPD